MKTVLIADDEPSVRRLMLAALASDQYQLVEATDGDEAWELILRHRPEVAILDVMMPGRTGLELATAIKDIATLSSTQVILLTGLGKDTDMYRGIASGADRYLTKPFSTRELQEAVEEALGL